MSTSDPKYSSTDDFFVPELVRVDVVFLLPLPAEPEEEDIFTSSSLLYRSTLLWLSFLLCCHHRMMDLFLSLPMRRAQYPIIDWGGEKEGLTFRGGKNPAPWKKADFFSDGESRRDGPLDREWKVCEREKRERKRKLSSSHGSLTDMTVWSIQIWEEIVDWDSKSESHFSLAFPNACSRKKIQKYIFLKKMRNFLLEESFLFNNLHVAT